MALIGLHVSTAGERCQMNRLAMPRGDMRIDVRCTDGLSCFCREAPSTGYTCSKQVDLLGGSDNYGSSVQSLATQCCQIAL